MNFDDFKLERAVLEVRYPNAYLLWDRAGALWTELEKKWAALKHVEANPAKTVFHLQLGYFYQLIVELSAARIIGHSPKDNLDEFTSVASDFMNEARDVLGVHLFERVGFRLYYFLQTKTWEEADTLVMKSKLINLPVGPFFSFESRSVRVEPIMLFTGDEVAARVRIASRQRRIDFDPPPELAVESMHQESFGVLFDVDYYTLLKVSVSQMDFREWIQTNHRHIRRDARKFVERS